MHIDPTTLRWYTAVATELHFGRAALALGIARTRLSKAIVELEGSLGYPLFDREQQGTQLTDAGRALLEQAPGLIAEGDERAALAAEEAAKPVPFRLSFVPGVTVTKWTTEWAERHPDIPLEVRPVASDERVAGLRDDLVDVAFVRLPIESEGLSAIRLYDEVPVVVVSKDNPLSLLEEVRVAELADENMLTESATVDDAIDLVAAGTGVIVLPHSVARLHARKDVVARPVLDLPETQIAIAWIAGDADERIDEFIGIVRGRKASSSRSGTTSSSPKAGNDEQLAAEKMRAEKARAEKSRAESKKPRTGAKGAKGTPSKTPRPLGTARKPRPSGGYRQKGR
ncbi:LysR family transcriptional regulator [Agreia sp. COWG]|uniref:LysR family transcriptional regulator n=1 Tax=Agreia sp. COWG TaxID=2773266 RepID=UPI0019290E38|nr:LysR substrate-binding domain-containing protein [Agreia sp. COWG]CAD6004951.1 HTH lysR-type domain-containing protein [Agreia sp. COWG]